MSASPNNQDFEQVLEEAKQAETLQEWCEAACIYQDLMGAHPDNPGLVLRTANALWLSDQPEEALELYRAMPLLDLDRRRSRPRGV